ncbi:MAG: hypothetical protein K2I37_04035 [Muribaculaceae bacterium]|nr:hypothetical protein [Muribaculaceae bacterium]
MAKDNPASPDQYDLDAPNYDYRSRLSEDSHSDSTDSYSLEDDEEADYSKSDNYRHGLPHREENGYDETHEEAPEEEAPTVATHRAAPAWRLLIGMMINPVEGWKKIRRARRSVEEMARDCFYPLIALAALSCFLECLWHSDYTLHMAVINAIIVFVAFFFGNFFVLLLIRWLFPKEISGIAGTDFGKKYVMYLLSTLALFYIAYRCLPMIGPVLVFLPLWTIYLSLRGARFFMLPEEKANLLKTLLCIFIVGAPIIVYWIMDLFL